MESMRVGQNSPASTWVGVFLVGAPPKSCLASPASNSDRCGVQCVIWGQAGEVGLQAEEVGIWRGEDANAPINRTRALVPTNRSV